MHRLAPYRKALAPPILALLTAVAQWVATGTLDVAELRTIAAGAVLSLAVFLVPNADAEDAVSWHWENGEPVRD